MPAIPIRVHDGNFDLYDLGSPITPAFERLVEDGNNDPLSDSFDDSRGTIYDATVGSAPLCPGETARLSFDFDLEDGVKHYFSYATMILPSNDAFLANGNPKEHLIIDNKGRTVNSRTVIRETGDDVLDGGTEVNDERPKTTAFFGQTVPDTGRVENGVVQFHPGLNRRGSGGILDSEEFSNADFTEGFRIMDIVLVVQ